MKNWLLKLIVSFLILIISAFFLLVGFGFALFALYQWGLVQIGVVPTALILAVLCLGLPLSFLAVLGLRYLAPADAAEKDTEPLLNNAGRPNWQALIQQRPLEAVLLALGLGWFFDSLPAALQSELKQQFSDFSQHFEE